MRRFCIAALLRCCVAALLRCFTVAPRTTACTHRRSSPEICELQYPIKMSEDVDVSKLRVKQLKKILADRGVECVGCLEKRDFVKRVKETGHMEL